jgi:hypothetical protein
MARKTSLSLENLAALGAEKLARIILDDARGNAPFRKKANAALAGAKGPEAVAGLIDRRLWPRRPPPRHARGHGGRHRRLAGPRQSHDL